MSNVYLRGLFTVCFGAGVALPAVAGPGVWTSNGPYGGNVYQIASESGNHFNMYAQSRGAFWRSVDDGDSWLPADNGLRAAYGAVPIVVDADQPQDVYVFDASWHLNRSSDRALNWAATGFELDADSFMPMDLVDLPGNTGQLLLLVFDLRTDGSEQVPLYRSTDGGVTFSVFGAGLPVGGAAVDLAIDPLNSSNMLLLYSPPEEGFGAPVAWQPTIYRSIDGGANWAAVHTPSGTTTYYYPYNYQPTQGLSFGGNDTVYASNGENLAAKSTDRGATWTEFTPAASPWPVQVVADPANGSRFWYTADDSVWLSLDGGATAARVDNGLTPNSSYEHATEVGRKIGLDVMQLHAAPGFPNIAGRRLWVAGNGAGLYRSTDLGSTWAASELGLLATQIRALSVDPNPASTQSGAGTGNRTVYGGFGDAFYSSPAMYRSNRLTGQWEQRNNGLRASQIRDVVVDPTTARPGDPITAAHVYATGRGALAFGFLSPPLYKSIDSGSNWTTIAAGLPERDYGGGNMVVDLGTVRRVVLDPRSCDLEPAAPTPVCAELAPAGNTSPLKRVYVSSNGFRDTTLVPGELNFTHRLLRSDDAGATWSRLDGNPGFPASRIFHTPSAGSGDDLYVSTQVTPIGIVIDPNNPDLLFVSTYASTYCQNITQDAECSNADLLATADVPSGVFKSTDRGATWTAVNNGLPRQGGGYANTVSSALSLAMHPTDANTLWVSVSDLQLDRALWPASIYRTNDGGATWVPSAVGIPQGVDIRAITVDAGDGDILYASGAGTDADPGAVYKSEDGGLTWTSLSIGLPADSALALAVDPFDATILHAGTNTGVWSIQQLPDADADGAPDSMELNAPNGGDGNGDGVNDYEQSAVGSTIALLASRPGESIAKRIARSKAAGVGFLTTEIVEGSTTGTCAQAVDVQTRLAAQYGRDFVGDKGEYYRYPRDLAQFEITDCSAASVDLIFHNADFSDSYGWSLRYYGPSTPGNEDTIGWHDVSQLAEQVSPNRWRVQLQANSFGSYRPVDDRILFIGGPACRDARVFVDDFEQVNRAKPGCDE